MTYDVHTALEAANLCDRAAAHMSRVGHAKSNFVEKTLLRQPCTNLDAIACCLVGAIRIVAGATADSIDDEHRDQPRTVREAEDWLALKILDAGGRRVYVDGGDEIDVVETSAEWNDADNCDRDSAVDMLRTAASAIRQWVAAVSEPKRDTTPTETRTEAA